MKDQVTGRKAPDGHSVSLRLQHPIAAELVDPQCEVRGRRIDACSRPAVAPGSPARPSSSRGLAERA
jgi:hypothetical protein